MSLPRKITWICLVVLAVVIKLLSLSSAAVERYYSMGLYPYLSRLQRLLFGWIPFSIGDLLYFFVAVWLVAGLVRLIRRLIRRDPGGGWGWGVLRRIVFALLLV